MSTFVQYVLMGLAMGGVYALVALGFHIMWSVAKAVNFAHGDTLMLGAVLTIIGMDYGISFWVAAPGAAFFAALFGMLLERFAVRPFTRTQGSIGWMLSTIAVGVMIESLATMVFGGFSRPLQTTGVEQSISILGAGVYPQELLIIAVALLAVSCLGLVQRHSLAGRAMRAVALDKDGAALMGIHVNRVVLVCFSLSAALGATAGILVAPVIQASATMGLLLGLKGFAVAIMGGITSAWGVVVAALLYGVIEKFVEGIWSTAARDIVGFSLMILVLLCFPQGMFGKREVFKV